MSRKVYLTLQVKMIVHLDEGLEVKEFVEELDHDFKDSTGKAQVEDTEILDYEVDDSK